MVKEIRILTKGEFYNLLVNASKDETKFMFEFIDPFAFFKNNAVEQKGLIIDKKPIYWGAITKFNGKYELWTVVNQNIKEQLTLYRETKKYMKELINKYGSFDAIMYKDNEKNIKWAEKLGAKRTFEDKDKIIFKIGG